ncbi:hypothetical protein SLS57_012428 [Botryosphaeria dothidea]
MVKLLSYTLGLIHIFSICTLHSSEARSLLILITEIGSALALSFRYEARIRSFPLDSVKFMNAAYALRLDKTLSWPFFSALVVLIGFSLVPASIWAGAITPIVVDNNNLSRTIDVPSLAHSTILADEGIFLNSQGLFTFDINNFRLFILNGAKDASPIPRDNNSDSLSMHAKLDKTGYSYLNRSYGAGSIIGISPIPNVHDPLHYSFREEGFLADVSCIRNRSANFTYQHTSCSSLQTIWKLAGTHPENVPAGPYVQVGFEFEPRDVLSWALSYGNRSTSVMVTTLASKTGAKPRSGYLEGSYEDAFGFADFNATQCRVSWSSHMFAVEVDNKNKTFAVTMFDETAWPSHADAFLGNMALRLEQFTFLDGALGGSMLGCAMRMNANNLNRTTTPTQRTPLEVPVQPSGDNEDVTLHSLEYFIEYAYDSTIMAMAACYDGPSVLGFSRCVRPFGQPPVDSQSTKGSAMISLIRNTASLAFWNETQQTAATVSVQTIVYGSAWYIYSIVAINVLVCVIYAAEAVRTRGGYRVSPVDFLDVADVVIATSRGGIWLARRLDGTMAGRIEDRERRRVAGTLMLRLESNNHAATADCSASLISANTDAAFY